MSVWQIRLRRRLRRSAPNQETLRPGGSDKLELTKAVTHAAAVAARRRRTRRNLVKKETSESACVAI